MRLAVSSLCSCALAIPLLALAGCGGSHSVMGSTSGSSAGSGHSGSNGGSSSGGSGTNGGSGGSGSGGSGGSSSSPAGPEFLYAVASGQQGSVYEYQIDTTQGTTTQGTLSALPGSPFTADVGNPSTVCTVGCGASLLADPLNRYVYYQFNYGSSTTTGVDSLQVDQTSGALTSGSQYISSVYEPAADPQGRFLYWNDDHAVGGAEIESCGCLQETPGQPYATGGTTAYGAPAVTANYVFLADYQSGLVEYSIDPATGTLTETANTAPLEDGMNPVAAPDGKFLYAEQMYMNNGTGYYEIVPIAVGTNGSLTVETQLAQQTPETGGPYLWMSPNGNFLYASVNGQLWDYQIDSTTGALTLVEKYPINTFLLAIDPEAQYVYLSPADANNVGSATVTAYSVNATSGALTPIANSTVNLPAIPVGLAVISPPQ